MGERVNILHISDLHYATEQAHDLGVVTQAFTRCLETLSATHLAPDLLVFSGDLVKRGDESQEYSNVFEIVLEKLTEGNCGDLIFTTPGNHDAQRHVVSNSLPLHERLRSIDTREELNSIAYEADITSLISAKFESYSRFERTIRSKFAFDEDPYYVSYYVSEMDLAIVCANTAWLSCAGLHEIRDEGFLTLPEMALTRAIDRLPTAKRRILVTHHPVSALKESNREDIVRLIRSNFDIHLFGHMHSAEPEYSTSLQGSTFSNQSGALFTDRKRFNGFSILSTHSQAPHIELNLRSYFDLRREFGIAENLLAGGVFYPTPGAAEFWKRQPHPIPEADLKDWLLKEMYPRLCDLFNRGFANKPVSEIFVEPPLAETPSDIGDDDPVEKRPRSITMDDILNADDNFVIVGKREFGKTTLLQQLSLRSISRAGGSRFLPCMIDFTEIGAGDRRVFRRLRLELPEELPRGVSFEDVLRQGRALVLIDDVNQRSTKGFAELRKFVQEFPRNRFIFSAPSEIYDDIGAAASLELPIPFRYVFLQDLPRSRLRTLVERWGAADDTDPDGMVNRLVSNMVQINIPLTAVSGTILLTIFEAKGDAAPLNKSVLIQQFIEALLEKWSPEDARRSRFDFTFKTNYLAHVAAEMVRLDTYTLGYDALVSITSDYFRGLGISQRSDSWIKQFLAARIFQEKGDFVGFKYRAFCEYFIALRMVEDETFKNQLISDENYLSFVNEIEYYSAMRRGDKDLIQMIAGRFKALGDSLFSELEWHPNIGLFQKLRRPRQKSPEKTFEAVEKEMQLPAITAAERDAILQGEIPKNLGIRQDVFRPVYADDAERWNVCLFLYSRILKNSELIPGDEKRRHLAEVLGGWAKFSMVTMLAIPILVRHRSIIINGVKYVVRMPKDMPDEEVAEQIYLAVPRSTCRLISLMVGSEKLATQLESELVPDGLSAEPLVVRFFRDFLAADLLLPGFVTRLEELSKSLRNSGYLREAMLSKLRELFHRVPLTKRQDEQLRRLTATIATDLYKPPRSLRSVSIEGRIRRDRTRKLVRQLRKGGGQSD